MMLQEGPVSANNIYKKIHQKLSGATHPLEAQSIALIVLEHLFKINKTDVVTGKGVVLTRELIKTFDNIISRINNHEPVQYVLGCTEFLGLTFQLNKNVLIPRPETEELVSLIINENPEAGLKVLDIGTGSGCIAVSLKKYLKEAGVFAIDVSNGALEVANQNAQNLGADIQFLKVNILTDIPDLPPIDIMVSNPPYVMEQEKQMMQPNVLEHEPSLALFVPDSDPLIFYRQIGKAANLLLNPGGKLYFEFNEKFGKELTRLLKTLHFREISVLKDMQNKDRFIKARKG